MTDQSTCRNSQEASDTTKILEDIRRLSLDLIESDRPPSFQGDTLRVAVLGRHLADKLVRLDELIVTGAGLPKQWEESILEEE